jgi:hypothetical protein
MKLHMLAVAAAEAGARLPGKQQQQQQEGTGVVTAAEAGVSAAGAGAGAGAEAGIGHIGTSRSSTAAAANNTAVETVVMSSIAAAAATTATSLAGVQQQAPTHLLVTADMDLNWLPGIGMHLWTKSSRQQMQLQELLPRGNACRKQLQRGKLRRQRLLLLHRSGGSAASTSLAS